MFSGAAQVAHQLFQYFFLSVLYVVLCAWLWWIKTRLPLLFASHINHNVIHKEGKKS
jgi:hypothetical protein